MAIEQYFPAALLDADFGPVGPKSASSKAA